MDTPNSSLLALEGDWGLVAERRVKALVVVELDVAEHLASRWRLMDQPMRQRVYLSSTTAR